MSKNITTSLSDDKYTQAVELGLGWCDYLQFGIEVKIMELNWGCSLWQKLQKNTDLIIELQSKLSKFERKEPKNNIVFEKKEE